MLVIFDLVILLLHNIPRKCSIYLHTKTYTNVKINKYNKIVH